MIEALRMEWIKVSTLTVNKVLVLIAVAFPIVVTSLVAALTSDFYSSADVADLIGGLGWLSALLFGVVATIGMAGEFHHNTIRPTFAAQPQRLLPLLAKLAIQVLTTALLTTGVVAASWLIATNVLEGEFALSEPEFGTGTPRIAFLGAVLLAIGVAIAGFGIGNLLRNTAAAVTLLLLWPLVIENILARLLFAALDVSWEKYLPFTQGLTLGIADRGDDTDELMSRLGAGIYFYVVVAAVAILGVLRTQRADA
jgi:ABC-2 type transport system permease protein